MSDRNQATHSNDDADFDSDRSKHALSDEHSQPDDFDRSNDSNKSADSKAMDGPSQSTPLNSNPVTIEGLIDQHHEVVFRYSFRLAGNQADAEDLSQQTFLIAQQKLEQLRNPESAKGWLLTICRNRFLKSIRRSQQATISSSELPVEEIPDELPGDDWIDSELIQNCLEQLPEEYRVVLLMFYFEQLSYKEIADQLDVKIGTVMSRLSRAKSRLRGLLFEED